jgi:hypothetical protein
MKMNEPRNGRWNRHELCASIPHDQQQRQQQQHHHHHHHCVCVLSWPRACDTKEARALPRAFFCSGSREPLNGSMNQLINRRRRMRAAAAAAATRAAEPGGREQGGGEKADKELDCATHSHTPNRLSLSARMSNSNPSLLTPLAKVKAAAVSVVALARSLPPPSHHLQTRWLSVWRCSFLARTGQWRLAGVAIIIIIIIILP